MALKGMPAPIADLDTQVFWDALGRDQLLLPHCAECDAPRWPPGPMCPYCYCDRTVWRDAPSVGTLYSWVVVEHPTHPALKDQVPYVLAMVEFAPRVRLLGNIVNWDGRALSGGEAVSVVFETRDDGIRLYNFKL